MPRSPSGAVVTEPGAEAAKLERSAGRGKELGSVWWGRQGQTRGQSGAMLGPEWAVRSGTVNLLGTEGLGRRGRATEGVPCLCSECASN